ncbi:alpha/beta fold hydrolase [Flavimaricola marinus]|uniref:Haloacetate dehalogenase H-1 n=1 Tax=Flavimaricola marinus TaxID=1819565 RepID=A0A238LHS2_9RHOB|nr:alpha/beta hydrolase [Flavimaricola marinus]SMY08440.1 Haloacetate dehalogenase H-1 [Flavimaricola marinus]
MPDYSAADGTRLHYSDDGTGLPVLCLAGLTRNGADFDHVAPHLKGTRLIRLDYRGRGKSDWADPATYTIPQEAQDVLGLLDHLGLKRVAILGTSRGGLIAMTLAAIAQERLLGVALNDIGPVIESKGLSIISGYVGQRPKEKTYEEAARNRANLWTHFADVPHQRWLAEVQAHYVETDDGLDLRYDPRLAEIFKNGGAQPVPDLWPLFDGFEGLPLALIRGANSDLLSKDTADEMSRRRPDMIRADIPDRGHVPFLDEPAAVAALTQWLEAMQ